MGPRWGQSKMPLLRYFYPGIAKYLTALMLALALVLCGCGQENRYVAPPPPKVTVAIPVQQKVTRYLEATGYASAINTTNLVARVQGFLQKINYKDGDQVKEGATLFVIEPEPYKLKPHSRDTNELSRL